MGGKKVKLAFIANDTSRKATYKKRVKCMMKKLNEITTLCGVKGCAIVFKPEDPEPQIWPSIQGVQSVLIQFMHIPEFQRERKMSNHESYLQERIQKMKDKLKKNMKDNRKMEMTLYLYKCLETGQVPENLSSVDKVDLINVIDEKIKETHRKIVELENDQRAHNNVNGR